MGSEQRNALLTVLLSGLILFGWQYFFAPPQTHAPVGPTNEVSKTEQPAKVSAEKGTEAAPVEPVQKEVFTIQGGGSTVSFDNSLAVENFENEQAAFKFNNTVGVNEPMKVDFDFGNGFQTLRFAKTDEVNKYYNSSYAATVVTSIDSKGVAQFKITSTTPFKHRFVFKSEAKKLENGQERVFAYYTD